MRSRWRLGLPSAVSPFTGHGALHAGVSGGAAVRRTGFVSQALEKSPLPKRVHTPVFSRSGGRASKRAARWFLRYEIQRRKSIARSAVEVEAASSYRRGAFYAEGRATASTSLPMARPRSSITRPAEFRPPAKWRSLLPRSCPWKPPCSWQARLASLKASSVRELIYIKLTGAGVAGEVTVAKFDVDVAAAQALDKLRRHVQRYGNPAQGYRFARDALQNDRCGRLRPFGARARMVRSQ